MNCPSCHKPAPVLFPGGFCPKCRDNPPPRAVAPPPPRKQNRGPPRKFCSDIAVEDYHNCIVCAARIIPGEREFLSHYRRRNTCGRQCVNELVRRAQLHRWKDRPRRAGGG